MKKTNKVIKSNIALNIKLFALVALVLFASFMLYRSFLSKPLIANVLDDYEYNTQQVEVTKNPKTGQSQYTVIRQRSGTGSVGIDLQSDIKVAQNGAALVKQKAIKKAVEEGKSQEEATIIGNQAAENSLHTSSAQIASGMASQLAIKNNLSEEERAALAANAYREVEKSLKNVNLSNLSSGLDSVFSPPGSGNQSGDGTSCGGKDAGIGDKQWAMLGDGTNKCVQCGGSRADGKGGPGVWGDQQVECGQGAAANYVAPIYQADKPKACWKNGVWYADTAGSVGDEKCLNGEWLDRAKFVAERQKQCNGMGQGYYYHEDKNDCEKTTATTPSGNPLVCGYGFEIKNNACSPTLVAGSIAGLERQCESKIGWEYNTANGLCEKSKVPLTAEQLKQIEVDKCKDLQKNTNKAGSTTWVTCSDEGQPAFQNCVGKGFNADGTSSCNLKPVEFGNNTSTTQAVGAMVNAGTGLLTGTAGVPGLVGAFFGTAGQAALNLLGISPSEQVDIVAGGAIGGVIQNPEKSMEIYNTVDATLDGAAEGGIITSLNKVPDAGRVDNYVGMGTGLVTAGASTPLCFPLTLANPLVGVPCYLLSFYAGASVGSKATDIYFYYSDK